MSRHDGLKYLGIWIKKKNMAIIHHKLTGSILTTIIMISNQDRCSRHFYIKTIQGETPLYIILTALTVIKLASSTQHHFPSEAVHPRDSMTIINTLKTVLS